MPHTTRSRKASLSSSASHGWRNHFAAEVRSSFFFTTLAGAARTALSAGCRLPDRRRYPPSFLPFENDDRALCVLQNRLVFFIQLFAGLKVEIFAGFPAPVGLALAGEIGLYVAL